MPTRRAPASQRLPIRPSRTIPQVHRRVRVPGSLALAAVVALASGCGPRITTEQEVRMGQDLAAQINRELPIVDHAPINR
jgi:hypothetical protein